jgi:ABC-type transport system substrate-binding protein
VKFVRNKHAEWHGKGQYNLPFFETAELSIIPEYANRLAQFLAGNIDGSDINGLDLPNVVKQVSDVNVEGRAGPTLSFFFFDSNPESPWNKDPRVRQAVSMSINRDDLTELGYNVKALRDAGLTVETPYHNLIPAGETRWWLDPLSADQGESSKFFKYNPTEAKALLSAAGFANGLDAGTYQYTANRYGKVFNDIAEQNIQYLAEVGIRTTTDVQDYASKYITQTFLGNFSGIAFGYQTPFPEAGSYLLRFFTDVPTNHSRIKDPALTKIAQDQAVELDEEARKELFWEAQRLNAEKMYYVPNQAGSGTGWTGYQPAIRNAVEYNTKAYGAPTETLVYFWRDA